MRLSGGWMAAAALAVTACLLAGCGGGEALLELRAGSLEIRITPEGRIGSFTDASGGREYLPEGMVPPLLTLRTEHGDLGPEGATFDPADSTVTLLFEDGLAATLRLTTRPTHLRLELVEVSDPAIVELAIWGPYPTTIGETIGETVGVVRGGGLRHGHPGTESEDAGRIPLE